MLFNSQEFLYLFLPVTILLFALLGKFFNVKYSIAVLIFSSVFYYAWWDYRFTALLLVSAVLNFSVGYILSEKNRSKLFLIFGIVINLLVLGYFKYANFFFDNLNAVTGTDFNLRNIILPLGISFFTFTQTAFLVECYRGNTKEGSIFHYFLFVAFFPQISAGPIAYHKEMSPQYRNHDNFRFSYDNLTLGFIIFCLGLFKKTVIADNLAVSVSPVFDNFQNGLDNTPKDNVLDLVNSWKAALAYTFQLYFDFSGYSDMAIGSAQMFGIKLPLNFNSPYKSKNIVEFWKRWHMTLSRFFRDYVFLPLSYSLSRKIPVNSLFGSDVFIYSTGIMVTWALTGLWHGAGWTFIVWGILHALYLIINRILKKPKKKILKKLSISEKNIFISGIYYVVTFLLVVTAWVYFRAPDFNTANSIITGMLGNNGMLDKTSTFDGSFLILTAMFIAFFMPNTQEFLSDFKTGINTYNQPLIKSRLNILNFKYSIKFSFILALLLTFSIIFVQSVQKMEFIYNDF